MPGHAADQLSEDSVLERVGNRMQQARKKARGGKGYTQEELAQILDVSPVTLSRWETGSRHPSFGKIEQYAQAVGKPLAYFFEPEPPEDDSVDALLRVVSRLGREERAEILNYARYRYQQWYEEQAHNQIAKAKE